MRYGDGLYFSSVSGKANDYAELSEKVPLFVSGTLFWVILYGKRLGHGERGRHVDPSVVFLRKSLTMTKVMQTTPNKVAYRDKAFCKV